MAKQLASSDDPASVANNLHHTVAYRSEKEWFDDIIGKGSSDPDYVGHYPGEQEETDTE